MSFTWSELVMIGIINYLKDPELVFYFMNILRIKKNLYIENESREFHCSMRLTMRERWSNARELRGKGLFNMMTSMVPITCPIPFSNREWRINSKCIREILYFRKGFMKVGYDLDNGISVRKEQTIREKNICLNLIMNKYTNITRRELEEACFDFILFEEHDDGDDDPYVMLEYDYDSQPFISIIN